MSKNTSFSSARISTGWIMVNGPSNVGPVDYSQIKDPSEWLLSEGSDWQPFPRWTLYLVNLGMALTKAFRTVRGRMLVCVSIPLRTYATPLIVSGYYIGKIKGGTAEEDLMWFNELKSRENPALATYLSRRDHELSVVRGYLDPPHSEEYLRLRCGPELHQLIDVHNVRFVSIHPGRVTPLRKSRTPTPIQDDSVFWQEVGIEPMAAIAALGGNRLDVVAMGIRSELIKDFSRLSVQISECAKSSLTLARLSGVRVSNSLPHAKTEIVSTRSEIPKLTTPTFAIFDGRAAFLDCEKYFRDCHRIIVADRLAAQQHNDTVDAVNRLFMDWRSDEDILSLLPSPPRGINLAAFTLKEAK